jgi:hypothetical protein
LAGDELSGEEQAKILSHAIGRLITYQEIPIAAARQQSEDVAVMFEWFDRVGADADIAALRRDFRRSAGIVLQTGPARLTGAFLNGRPLSHEVAGEGFRKPARRMTGGAAAEPTFETFHYFAIAHSERLSKRKDSEASQKAASKPLSRETGKVASDQTRLPRRMELHHLSNPFPSNRSGYFLRRTN